MSIVAKYLIITFIVLVHVRESVTGLSDVEIKDKIDSFVNSAIECASIPGLTLSVVRNKTDFIAKGYGVRNLTEIEPVTNETMFLLASVSKAFTGITAAIVIKNETESGTGRLNWRTPIHEFLSTVEEYLYFNDTLRTELANLRDIFGHRTGLSFNNAIRIYGYDIDEAMYRLQFLPFVNDFRDDYVFNNILFGLAAWVLEKADGRTWEEIAWQELLEPIGMTASTFMKQESRWPEFATGHYIDENTSEPRAVSLEVTKAYFEAFSAAGSVGSNAIDMLQWIKFQLNNGKTEAGREILSREEFEFTHLPSMQRRAPPRYEKPRDEVTYKFGTHSVAWNENSYRDNRISQHLGGETGFLSLITISRSNDFGIFTGVNKDPHQGAMDYIHMFIMDLLLGVEPWLNETQVCDVIKERAYETCEVCDFNRNVFSQWKHERENSDSKDAIKRRQSAALKNAKSKSLTNIDENDYLKRQLYQKEILINGRTSLRNMTGRYGHHAYGNVTVFLNESSDALYMVYGLDGKYAWTWDLSPTEENGMEFQGIGQDLIWYYKIMVIFEAEEDESINRLYVDFDRQLPPRFERNLDWNFAPPPPDYCNGY